MLGIIFFWFLKNENNWTIDNISHKVLTLMSWPGFNPQYPMVPLGLARRWLKTKVWTQFAEIKLLICLYWKKHTQRALEEIVHEVRSYLCQPQLDNWHPLMELLYTYIHTTSLEIQKKINTHIALFRGLKLNHILWNYFLFTFISFLCFI